MANAASSTALTGATLSIFRIGLDMLDRCLANRNPFLFARHPTFTKCTVARISAIFGTRSPQRSQRQTQVANRTAIEPYLLIGLATGLESPATNVPINERAVDSTHRCR